jgi:hypothetical protein
VQTAGGSGFLRSGSREERSNHDAWPMLVESHPEHKVRSGPEAALLTQYLGMDGGEEVDVPCRRGWEVTYIQRHRGNKLSSPVPGRREGVETPVDRPGPHSLHWQTGPCTAELTVQLAQTGASGG